MRWFLGVAGLIAVLVGTAAAAGILFLPAEQVVTRSLTVQRPASAVYALVSTLRTFEEYTSWREIDPAIELVFDGPADGIGQTARWSSPAASLRSGALEVVEVTPLKTVRIALREDDRAPGEILISLTEERQGLRVDWSLTRRCPAGPAGLPCRYALASSKGYQAVLLESGLRRLAGLAEALPDEDFAKLSYQILTVPPIEFLGATAESSMTPQAAVTAERAALAGVGAAAQALGLARKGEAVVVTTRWDGTADRYGFRAGYAFDGPSPIAAPDLQVGRTQGGRVLKAVHAAPYQDLDDTYAMIDAAMRAYRLTAAGAPWHVYQGELPEDASLSTRIDVFFPLGDPTQDQPPPEPTAPPR